jgi:GNAT superfamily N-acetyltransferase
VTPDDVVSASNAWVYVPDGSPTFETEDYLLVRFPDHFANALELVRFTPVRPVSDVVAEVLERAARFAVPELVWRVRLDSPEGTDEVLSGIGGMVDETLDVFALDLAAGLPDLGSSEAELVWATDVAAHRDAHRVEIEVFGGSMPPDDQLHRDAARGAVGLRVGRGGSVVAYLDGRLAGTGGISSRGPAAGLWGGAVLEEFRGRGVYRALLAERLAYAAAHEMTMALVKGRVETSGPILRRAGFGAFGQERSYRIPLATSS